MKSLRPVTLVLAVIAVSYGAFAARSQQEANSCESCRHIVADPRVCTSALHDVVSHPSRSIAAMGLRDYQVAVGRFMAAFCYRANGWEHDARIRDTGPLLMDFRNGAFTSVKVTQHNAVDVWYSPDMSSWLKRNRPADEDQAPANPPPAPEGGILVKEMWHQPASQFAGDCIECMNPYTDKNSSGVAYMIREAQGLSAEWYYGYYGNGTEPDYPAQPGNGISPNAGDGGPSFCYNCHASAKDNNTFITAGNLDPDHPAIPFASQTLPPFPTPALATVHHEQVFAAPDRISRLGDGEEPYEPFYLRDIPVGNFPRPSWESVNSLPSQTYDDVYVQGRPPQGPGPDSYLTSTQCIGCHSAYATGLQYYMSEPNPVKTGPYKDALVDFSPYMTWRSSPMGMSGRDPIFFAQLESERVLHGALAKDGAPKRNPTANQKKLDGLIQDLCLQCHGIMGERQFQVDRNQSAGTCTEFRREMIDAVPFPFPNPTFADAKYGSLGRDGIACSTCHHAVVGPNGVDFPENPNEKLDPVQSACVEKKQDEQNPGFLHFAKTFTGNFLVGPRENVYGPYADPKTLPMENALGLTPQGGKTISSSEMCGTCHTVHLPVFGPEGNLLKYIYEQTTYAEWVFSEYRNEITIAGQTIPAGSLNQSCADCHLPDKDENGKPTQSRIADIEQHTPNPATDYNHGPDEIDIPVRSPFSRHLLVGLNVFFIEMAKQFPDVLGIATKIGLSSYTDPTGVPPLIETEKAMVKQAAETTAEAQIGNIRWDPYAGKLAADVTIDNKVGHSFPSGVGFRRVFVEFSVLDQDGSLLWASGRTNQAGVLVDENNQPIRGEFWWPDDCSVKYTVRQAGYQPHYSQADPVTTQNQAQIYQELELAPDGKFTTSFVSIDRGFKDNRLLPKGFLPIDAPAGRLSRRSIATILGDTTPFIDPSKDPKASVNLAWGVEPEGRAAEDPDYKTGGKDTLTYVATLSEGQQPAFVQAKVYFQAIPPFYQQDRYCIAQGKDTQRLYFVAGHLNLEESSAPDWKLLVTDSGKVAVAR